MTQPPAILSSGSADCVAAMTCAGIRASWHLDVALGCFLINNSMAQLGVNRKRHAEGHESEDEISD